MKIRGKDYRKLPIGTKLGGKEIGLCPHCGQHGLVEEKDGTTFYVHIDAVELEEPVKTRFVMCPKK